MYLEGRGVAKNPDIALELLQIASEDIPTAHNFIGVWYKLQKLCGFGFISSLISLAVELCDFLSVF